MLVQGLGLFWQLWSVEKTPGVLGDHLTHYFSDLTLQNRLKNTKNIVYVDAMEYVAHDAMTVVAINRSAN